MSAAPADETRRGIAYAFAAYGIWGAFPLYFAALEPAGAIEILSHRILWTLVFCAAVLMVRHDLGWIRQLLARPALAAGIAMAAVFIAGNWGFYVYAVLTGRTTEAALGYFLNPLVTVALGVVVLREPLRPLQWLAVSIGAVAAVYLAIAAGGMPWLSLVLAGSFALYGLVKKKVGASLAAMQSLAAETVVLAPVALGLLVWVDARGESTLVGYGALHTGLLLAAGVVTAIPLLLFTSSTRRIPLVTVGLIQFITPVLQLIVAVTLLGEQLSDARWVGFGIVWVALIVLSTDSLRARSTRLRAQVGTGEPATP